MELSSARLTLQLMNVSCVAIQSSDIWKSNPNAAQSFSQLRQKHYLIEDWIFAPWQPNMTEDCSQFAHVNAQVDHSLPKYSVFILTWHTDRCVNTVTCFVSGPGLSLESVALNLALYERDSNWSFLNWRGLLGEERRGEKPWRADHTDGSGVTKQMVWNSSIGL